MAEQHGGDGRFIEGERIYLRAVCATDVNERYHRWMNDPHVGQFLETRFSPSSLESIAAYVRRMTEDPDIRFLAIVLKEGDLHIGNIKIGPIDWIHRFADVSLIIGEKACWGKGLGTEAIQLMVGYAFEVLNLRKLTAGAYVGNVGSIRAFEKADFVGEGLRRKQRFSAGTYTDEVLLGLIREERGRGDGGVNPPTSAGPSTPRRAAG